MMMPTAIPIWRLDSSAVSRFRIVRRPTTRRIRIHRETDRSCTPSSSSRRSPGPSATRCSGHRPPPPRAPRGPSTSFAVSTLVRLARRTGRPRRRNGLQRRFRVWPTLIQLSSVPCAGRNRCCGRQGRVHVNSGWRSPEYEEQLLHEAVSKYGWEGEAARWVATPNTSAHVSGDAVDIGPTDATAWLSEHGAEYGLCQIYGNEPWHYELRPAASDHGCPPIYADPRGSRDHHA